MAGVSWLGKGRARAAMNPIGAKTRKAMTKPRRMTPR
jgi:hypothetical protein